MKLNLPKITQFRSPKIVVETEKFEYNYYVNKEAEIPDNSFKNLKQNDKTKSIIANEEILPPRRVLLSLDLKNLSEFNKKIDTNKGNLVSNNPGVIQKLNNLAAAASLSEELRNANFNERFNLNLRFYQDNNIDLTFDEDLSFMYDIMTDALDTEEPNDIIFNSNSNRSFLQYSKKLEEYNSPSGTRLRRLQKLGNNSTKNIEYIERLNKANNNKYTGFLDDKSALNNKNYKENKFFKKFNSFAEESNAKETNITKKKEFINSKPFFSTAEYISLIKKEDFNDKFEYTPGLVVGYIVDKYKVDENLNKTYLCTRFYQLNNNNKVNVEDTAVQYGKKYIYEFKSVHLFLLYNQKNSIDYHDFLLVLGDKTISNIVHIIERESPNIPTSLICSYNKGRQGIRLRWGMPSNPQLDIFNFQIFRRESLFEPFTLIKEIRELDINVNSDIGFEEPNQESVDKSGIKFNFLDTEIKKDKTYIYAICAIDAHGISSALSAQVACKYNRILTRLDTDTISLGGALKYYPNQFIPRKTKFFDNERSVFNNTPIIKNKDKFKIYFTPDYQSIKVGTDFQEIVKTINNVADNNHNANDNSHYIFNLTNINTLSYKSQNIYIKK